MSLPVLLALAGLLACSVIKLGVAAGIGVTLAVWLLMPYIPNR